MELEKLEKLIGEIVNIDGYRISEDTVLSDDLGMDALDVYELVMEIENALDIEFPQETSPGIRTVGELLTEIESITGVGEV